MQLFAQKTGKGQPLIILHALFGMSDNWLSIGKSLGQQGFAVHLPDIRNHGRSPHMPSHTYRDLCDDLLAYLRQEGIEKTGIIGHSMGGKMAMWFGLLHSNMVTKLAVIDIAPGATKKNSAAGHKAIIENLQAMNLGGYKSRQAIVQDLEDVLGDRTLARFFGKSLKRDDGGQFSWRLNLPVLLKSLPVIAASLDQLQNRAPSPVTALFVKGANSDYIQSEDQADINDYFPHAEVVTVANAGHWLQMDQPEKLLELLSAFFNEK